MSWSLDLQVLIVTILRQLLQIPWFRGRLIRENRFYQIVYHGSRRPAHFEDVSIVIILHYFPL